MPPKGKKLFLVLLVMMVTTFWPPGLRAAPSPGREVVFYYSNDVRGETKPCG